MNIESGLETRRPAFFYKFTLLLLLGSALVSVVLKTLVLLGDRGVDRRPKT